MNIETLLDEQLKKMLNGGKTITGANYFRLFGIAYKNGFSDAKFKEYLGLRDVEKLESNEPPQETMRNTRLM